MMFGQTFDTHDLPVIALLIVLEGVLSIDNALVLGLLAKRLPKQQQSKALTYGLIGAFVFRFIAIALATVLLKWTVFKLLGGAYLIWVAVKHFFFESKEVVEERILVRSGQPELVDSQTGAELSEAERERKILEYAPVPAPARVMGTAAFWPTVFVIEMTDIAFAVDSIVAAIGVVGQPPPGHPVDATHPKLWVVILGGFIGVILMRFAAALFIKILDRFPRFETAAYLLVTVIGLKLVIDWGGNKFFASPGNDHPINFHSWSHPETWIFWISMLLCFGIGFLPGKKAHVSRAG